MSTSAYFRLVHTERNAVSHLDVARARYSRVLNDVGRLELEAYLPQIDVWAAFVGHAAIAMYFGGRCEDIWVVKDYERVRRGGLVRVYGENLAYLLRDSQRKAPMGSTGSANTAAKMSGDIGELMLRVSYVPASEPAAFELDYALWRPTNYRAGFQTTVDYQWGSPASAMSFLSEISTALFGSRYRASWYVRGHTLESSRVAASLFFVHPHHVAVPLRMVDVSSVKVEHSNAAGIISGIGAGSGAERVVQTTVSPALTASRNRALARVEKAISTAGSDSRAAMRAAVRRYTTERGGEVVLYPNARYFEWFELGSFVTLPTYGGFFPSNVALSGYVSQIDGEYEWGNVQHTIRLVG